MKQDIKTRFLKDTSKHTMTVLRDDGVYRHLRFSNDGSSVYRFDLITWPGYLAYVGDMGDYVFARVEDMFEFFRKHHNDSELTINLGYWSEKVQAYCRDGIREYSSEKFLEVIDDLSKNYWVNVLEDKSEGDDSETTESRIAFMDAVQEEVKDYADDQQTAYDSANNFEWEGDDQVFSEFYEHDLTDYTFRFEWCCWAIVLGINKYDTKKDGVN